MHWAFINFMMVDHYPKFQQETNQLSFLLQVIPGSTGVSK